MKLSEFILSDINKNLPNDDMAILNELFNPYAKDCQTVFDDLQQAMMLDDKLLIKVLEAMNACKKK